MAKAEQNTNIFYLLRIARGMSVRKLSEKLSITPAYINAIEKGDKFPAERLLRDYAQALGVDESVIRNFSEERYKNRPYERVLLSVLQIICNISDQ